MNWVVGDIHGMLRPLTTLLAAIDDLDPDHRLYFCGDYCDRGPDTRGVVDALIPLVESGRAVCVRGNHDDVFDLCLNRHSLASGEATGGSATEQDVKEAVRLFWREGLLETMRSYGVDLSQVGRMIGDRGGIDAWVQEQFARVPESHRRFFRTLPAVAETDGFFVAHATWPPELADGPLGGMNALLAKDALLRHDTIWGRYVANQLRSRKAWSRRGYFGHTPTDTYAAHADLYGVEGDVIEGDTIVLLDTAAFARGGRLSAVCHETGELVQVGHDGTLYDFE